MAATGFDCNMLHAPNLAAGNLYTASIPGSALTAGSMVRWNVQVGLPSALWGRCLLQGAVGFTVGLPAAFSGLPLAYLSSKAVQPVQVCAHKGSLSIHTPWPVQVDELAAALSAGLLPACQAVAWH